jgi:hypothetical protein
MDGQRVGAKGRGETQRGGAATKSEAGDSEKGLLLSHHVAAAKPR